MDRVTVVLVDVGDEVPDVLVFESAEKADEWASIRGSVSDKFVTTPITDGEADRMIKDEVKERRDEERMKQAGL